MKREFVKNYYKVEADEGHILYWNYAFMYKIYSPNVIPIEDIIEISIEELTEPGRQWQASPGYGWVNMNIPNNAQWESIVTIEEGDDIRNYQEVEVQQ